MLRTRPDRKHPQIDKAPLLQNSDVCFSTRWIRPEAPAAWRSFGANRILWVYLEKGTPEDGQYIKNAKDGGIKSFQATINANQIVEDLNAYAVNIEGQHVVAPWMIAMHKESPRYWGCNNQPAYFEKCLQTAIAGLDAGADWIQFDDWMGIVSAYNWGGACFCGRCMLEFEKYLRRKLAVDEARALGIDDLDGFNYKTHLATKLRVATDGDYRAQRINLPLDSFFRKFQIESVRKFVAALRERLDAHAGHRVPFSINANLESPRQDLILADTVDFFLAEEWVLTPVKSFFQSVIACKIADALGKSLVLSLYPHNIPDTRHKIAVGYGLGHPVLVPWDIYMGSDEKKINPRYFGKPEEYGDLYRFVREHSGLLDGFETPASVVIVVNVDRYEAEPVADVCRRLLEAQVPFTFVLTGYSVYDLSLDADTLKRFKAIVRVNKPDAFRTSDLKELESASKQTPVLTPDELTPAGMEPFSLGRYWGPRNVFFLPRMKASANGNQLVFHVLNYNLRDYDGQPVPVKWSSLLLYPAAMPALHLKTARWHAPGKVAETLEVESLEEGFRIIIPEIGPWGILECDFSEPCEPFAVNGEGFIQAWLICGPFPNPGEDGKTVTFPGWEKDWLVKDGGEEQLEPGTGMSYEVKFPDVMCSDGKKTYRPWIETDINVEWKKFFTKGSRINLLEAFVNDRLKTEKVEFVAGYAYCVVESPKEQDVTLGFGSDDGYKIWLNHKLVGSSCNRRGSNVDQDKFPVHLQAGENALMIKVDQSIGGYNFYARFLDNAGKPITNLKIRYIKSNGDRRKQARRIGRRK